VGHLWVSSSAPVTTLIITIVGSPLACGQISLPVHVTDACSTIRRDGIPVFRCECTVADIYAAIRAHTYWYGFFPVYLMKQICAIITYMPHTPQECMVYATYTGKNPYQYVCARIAAYISATVHSHLNTGIPSRRIVEHASVTCTGREIWPQVSGDPTMVIISVVTGALLLTQRWPTDQQSGSDPAGVTYINKIEASTIQAMGVAECRSKTAKPISIHA